MRKYILLCFIFFSFSCSQSRLQLSQPEIERVVNPYLFFHEKGGAWEGIILGELPLAIQFTTFEIDRNNDSLIISGITKDLETDYPLSAKVFIGEPSKLNTPYVIPKEAFNYSHIVTLESDSVGRFHARLKLKVKSTTFISGYLLSYYGVIYHIGFFLPK
ncbi:hypothetical protein JNL27_17355 [bacterium]|nr:hypothetical protein [bacterium]